MNILIADDEPKLRRGLVNYLSKMDLYFEKIEVAENGEVALEKAREIKPDIIFLDICMPKMTGIEFIEMLSLECEQPEIVIISGFNDFSYVQQALRYKVSDYLLKPINLLDFDNLVHKIYNEIMLKKKHEAYTDFALDTIKKHKDQLCDAFFSDALRGLLTLDEIKRQAKVLDISFPHEAYMVIVVFTESSKNHTSHWNNETLRFAIKNILSETCDGAKNVSVFFNHKNDGILICDKEVVIKDICESIENNIHKTLGFQTRTVAKEFEGYDFKSVYSDAKNSMNKMDNMFSYVKQAKTYIDKNFVYKNITLQSVADSIGIGASYLSSLMREQLGVSFVDYLVDVRMKNAALLIKNSPPDMMMYEVADEVGYSSQHYFSRVFKAFYGMSPLQYREKYYEN